MEIPVSQQERRRYLIDYLLGENPTYRDIAVPDDEQTQKKLLRSLMNVRWAAPLDGTVLAVQDAYLGTVNAERGIVTLADAQEREPGLYLWQGDITRLKVDAIVNAANSGMTGCYQPCHACIDNCIHTYAGMQLRNFCAAIMEEQGHEEPTGQARITPAYNLPCRYILHTVGPIVRGPLTEEHERLLASSYESCLTLAEENGCGSIAFCCISTGVFMFPGRRAAEIAVDTVRAHRARTGSGIRVVFNVFLDEDRRIYEALLPVKA